MYKPANFPYNTPATVVVFRRWADTGEVIALFPGVSEGAGRCSSFMHLGQHAAADFAGVVARTVRARAQAEQDVRDLCAELISAPYFYHLKPVLAEDVAA